MKWMGRLKIMPLLIVVAALCFGVRFGDFITGVSSLPGTANAQQTIGVNEDTVAEVEQEEAVEDQLAQLDAPPRPDMQEPGTTMPSPPSMEGAEEPTDWKDSGDTDFEFSEMRMELFEDLTRRRQTLEAQEREMAVREALLKAAEKELDQKYKELVSLRTEIQDLLKEQTEEEKKRTASLVKIYEGMKPKDAARIFNTLDMDVLLNVVSRMSERKSAPIIASMDPARARSLTIMLMEQKSLPTLLDDVNS